MAAPPPDPPKRVEPIDFFKKLKGETEETRWAEVYASWVSIASGGGIGTNRRQRLGVDNDELVTQAPIDEASSRYSPWVMTTHPSGWIEVMDGNVSHITGYLVGLRDPDGALLWTWRHPDADFTMDAAVATDGTVYAVTDASRTVGPQSEVGLVLTRIDGVTGVGVDVVTIWPDDLPTPPYGGTNPEMTPVSISLSADDSVAYILVTGGGNWSNPGIQTLLGVDTQTGELLWQHLLERERPGDYYGIYNYYDGAQVRSVPGEDTCYVNYNTYVTDNEWKSTSLGRVEFPNGPRQQPTQVWTRLPFSVEEINQFSQWAGPRSLAVTEDGVVIGVEQGFDSPEPVRLILKYDHSGNLKWTWGEDENLEYNAAITANSIAVAGGVVFFGYDFGEATPLFPESAGMGALDYETGGFLGLGYFPVDTYWEGRFAAYGEVIPGSEIDPPADYFKNLEFPCPPLEFYAYGIDGDNNFFLARYQADGTAKWYYNATWYEGEDPVNFPNQNDQLSDSLNGWPGYGGGSSTLDGYFAHALDGNVDSLDRYGFYHVGPDKEYLGYKMMLPLGVDPDGARGGWGQEVARDADGDHYACYYSYGYFGGEWDMVVVVGWRGTGASPGDEKWRITQSQIPDPYEKGPIPGSITLAPDGTTLIIAYSEGIYQGVNKDSGAVLWTFSFRDEALAKDVEWMMENTVRAVFAPQGHLLLDVEMAHYIIHPDEGFGEYWQVDSVYGAVVALDFPDGYEFMPVVAWETDVGLDLTPCWLVGLPDGGAIMNSSSHDGVPMLVRVDAGGNIVWNHDISDEMADALWDEPYSPMVLIGDRVHATLTFIGQSDSFMYPFNVKTGAVDIREGESWPLPSWQIGAPAVVRPDSADCRPLPTDYFKKLERPQPVPAPPPDVGVLDLAGMFRAYKSETGEPVAGPWDEYGGWSTLSTQNWPYDAAWALESVPGHYLLGISSVDEWRDIWGWGVLKMALDGTRKWFAALPGDWVVALAVNPAGDTLLVVSEDTLYTIPIDTGELNAFAGLYAGQPALDLTWESAAWTAEGNVVVSDGASRPGEALCYDLEGNLVWSFPIPGRPATLAVHGDYAYIADGSGATSGAPLFVYKVRTADGVESTGGLWPYPADGGVRKIVAKGDKLYLGDHDSILTCLDLNTQTVAYTVGPFEDWVYGIAVDDEGFAYIATSISEGMTHKIDPEGNVLWSTPGVFVNNDVQDVALGVREAIEPEGDGIIDFFGYDESEEDDPPLNE